QPARPYLPRRGAESAPRKTVRPGGAEKSGQRAASLGRPAWSGRPRRCAFSRARLVARFRGTNRAMIQIDMRGKRAFVAGVAADGGYGFAIAKALAEAGATVCLGTWPPALNIFRSLLERGKLDPSLKMSSGDKLAFERIYPLDAAYDELAQAPEDVRTN